VGGNWNNSSNAGLFYWNLNNDLGNTNFNIGARLSMVKHCTILATWQKMARKGIV